MRILIADDNHQNLYLARYLLEQKGHKIKEAYNGQEAVETCKTDSFDLVIMDIQMPVLNGLEATRSIKQMENPPLIIALTAKAMRGDAEKILAAGCDGYIAKPLDPANFAQQVEAFIKDTATV